MPLDPDLLEILACPDCKTPVVEVDNTLVCTNADCRRRYAIDDGIPVMLIEESTVLDPEAWKAATGGGAQS